MKNRKESNHFFWLEEIPKVIFIGHLQAAVVSYGFFRDTDYAHAIMIWQASELINSLSAWRQLNLIFLKLYLHHCYASWKFSGILLLCRIFRGGLSETTRHWSEVRQALFKSFSAGFPPVKMVWHCPSMLCLLRWHGGKTIPNLLRTWRFGGLRVWDHTLLLLGQPISITCLCTNSFSYISIFPRYIFILFPFKIKLKCQLLLEVFLGYFNLLWVLLEL